MNDRHTVSVFGSSAPREGDGLYEDGLSLGAGLAQAGFAVATGGYSGVMESVCRGAAEAGGWTIGFTCDQLELWRPGPANRWVQHEVRSATLRERVVRLIEAGTVLIALAGGIGTLSEVALTWSLLQTGELSARPLILVGESWAETLRAFLAGSGRYVPASDAGRLSFVPDVDAAVKTTVAWHVAREG
jgi:uncharacterized protein (TIGR00730 family)